jgi:hypothetical protein
MARWALQQERAAWSTLPQRHKPFIALLALNERAALAVSSGLEAQEHALACHARGTL